jgi:hypothetical protein
MKRLIYVVALFALTSTSAMSATTTPAPATFDDKPSFFVGATYAFGGSNGLGFTLMITNTRRENRGFGAIGLSYHPTTGNMGLPVGIGYQGNNAAIMGGYDLLLKQPVLGGGYSDTKAEPVAAPVYR